MVLARDYTIDYNNFLTRSIIDSLYCHIDGSNCVLGGGGIGVWIIRNLVEINTSATGGVDDVNITGDLHVIGTVGNYTHRYTWGDLNTTGAGDNVSWNETYANTLYTPATFNRTLADNLYTNETDTDTWWGLNENYIYNNSNSLDFNETRLNYSIDNRTAGFVPVNTTTDESVCTYEFDSLSLECDTATSGSGDFLKQTTATIVTPYFTLSTISSTAIGRIYYDSSNDWIGLGDGSSSDTFVPVNTKTDEFMCTYESTGTSLECDTDVSSWDTNSGDDVTASWTNLTYLDHVNEGSLNATGISEFNSTSIEEYNTTCSIIKRKGSSGGIVLC